MRERGIIFSGDNPKLILEGRKIHTRRIADVPNWVKSVQQVGPWFEFIGDHPNGKCGHKRCACIAPPPPPHPCTFTVKCPFGVAGDRLWVREKWRPCRPVDKYYAIQYGDESYGPFGERIGVPKYDGKWRPSIHMPKWASRITLEITKVRVERLQDITEKDAKAEGVSNDHSRRWPSTQIGSMQDVYRRNYAQLWDSLHGKGGWDKNPWVWVIEFRLSKETEFSNETPTPESADKRGD